MKKTIALVLALIMALSMLAACGGDSDTPDGGDDTQTPTQTQSPSPAPGGTDGDTTSGGGIEIPDNGTPPDVPAPFESHPGDRGYFFVDTGDYAVLMYDAANDRGNSGAPFGPCVQYYVMSFDETDYTSRFHKWVFENEADARTFAASDTNTFIAIGNVVYRDYDPDIQHAALSYYGKAAHVRSLVGTTWQLGGEVYLSVPDGFEELLADTGMKGRTGSMTLREAFADAGFIDLPDGPDYDATSFILTFGYDDYFNMTTAAVMFFDGETEIQYISFRFFDDPAAPEFSESAGLGRTKSEYLGYLPQQTRGAGNLCYVGT